MSKKSMKIEQKLIVSYRVKPDEARQIRKVSDGIYKETGIRIGESKLIDFLIQEGTKRIKVVGDEIKLL